MKPQYLLLGLGLVLPGFVAAQTRPTSSAPQSTTTNATNRPSVRPPATRPAAPDATTQPNSAGTTPNRQQELYDQYHGITKKPTPPPPVPATQPTRPTETAPAPVVASAPAESASSHDDAAIRIGVRGGVTYPIYLEQQTGVDPAVGFVGGVVAQFGRGKLSFQPEINYRRVAASIKVAGVTFNNAVDQVVVPLFLKIASGTFDGNRFFLNVGPYGAYTSSASQNGVKIDLSGSEGRLSFGAAAGIGAMLKAGPGHVTVELRGLYELGDNSKGSYQSSKTIIGEGTLGYVFPLGSR